MCEITKKIIFCSCQETSNNQELVGKYQWTLERYIGSKETRARGRIMRSSDLDDEFKIKDVILEMNERNCFDFDYIHKERDCFEINNGHESPNYKYFSLIYRDGKWKEGRNPAFGATITENIAKGKVKRID